MKADLKRNWVEALRSGSYAQGKQVLRGGEAGQIRYCCLGVLADVAGATWEKDDGWEFYRARFPEAPGAASGHVPESILDRDIQGELIELNDVDELDFPAIADWIEKNVPVGSET